MTNPHGLTPEQILQIQNILVRNISDRQLWQVDVFGSRARGDHKKYSDLDLWIETEPSLTAEKIQTIRDEFEQSELPIKIDIVTPQSVLDAYKISIMKEKIEWLRGP
jgi:predicted nucleotidyltransferase